MVAEGSENAAASAKGMTTALLFLADKSQYESRKYRIETDSVENEIVDQTTGAATTF
jgi:hypothetical protein